jgi:tetratricopeptide (TPR) repeat protein
MKKILTVIGLVLINLGLVYFALRIHFGATMQLVKLTNAPRDIESFVFIPFVLAGIVIFSFDEEFRRFGVGLTAFSVSSLIFLFFFLNNNLASEGEYVSYKLKGAVSTDKKYFLNIEFKPRLKSIEVTLEKCLNVDSVQVRIDKGFFGLNIMTNNVRIVENTNCDHAALESNDLANSYLNMGHALAKKRCFTDAIYYYSKLIALEPKVFNNYNHRGYIYLVISDYKNALADFLLSSYLKFYQLDKKTIDFIDTVNLAKYKKELVDKLHNKKYLALGKNIIQFKTIYDFETYFKNIKYCLKKLKEKNVGNHPKSKSIKNTI